MGVRMFLARLILGYEPAPKPAPKPLRRVPTDPLVLLQQDALLLLSRIYDFGDWTRQEMVNSGYMSQPRWNSAFHLLRSLDIIDRRREIVYSHCSHAENYLVAEIRVKHAIERRRAKPRPRNFVSPYPERRGSG